MDKIRPASKADWYRINHPEQIDSPALLYYQERIQENIELIKGSINDINRLRPHVKTHKSAVITEMLLEAGIRKFKCATIAEAEMLAACKAPDVLLAYQPVGPKLDRWIALMHAYPQTEFSCLTDHAEAARAMTQAALENGLLLNIYLDVNIGMNRTGVANGTPAFSLYLQLQQLPGLKIKGIHAYDGHIHDSLIAVRTAKCLPIIADLQALIAQILEAGFPEPVLIAGGSPTFPIYAAEEEIECSPGTFILWDKGYQDAYPEQAFLPAAVLLSRVVSLTQPHLVTLDLGHKAIAAENPLDKRVHFLNAPAARFISQSEEHLVLDLGENHGCQVGDVFYGLPIHVCPTVALYERAHLIVNQEYKADLITKARNRKITF